MRIYVMMGLGFCILAGLQVYLHLNQPKVAYLKTNELYDGFELSKELDNKYMVTQTARKELLDSLKIRLQVLSREIEINQIKQGEEIKRFQVLREEYYLKEQQFSEDNKALMQQYNNQILNQLNQYVQEYGEKYNYQFILGASGSGSLMYANEQDNVTKEVLKYANERYDGMGN
ncbi:OmpH family outer membrane protein [Bacteroidales bacterium AH-315-I05]|nr:OmpH family outer membrane protein [Bacteroidales bacterium AH-315-I05]